MTKQNESTFEEKLKFEHMKRGAEILGLRNNLPNNWNSRIIREVKPVCTDLRHGPKCNGICKNAMRQVEQPAPTCPQCGDPIALHGKNGCNKKSCDNGVWDICQCDFTPADLKPAEPQEMPLLTNKQILVLPVTLKCHIFEPDMADLLITQRDADMAWYNEWIAVMTRQQQDIMPAHDAEVVAKAVKEFAEKAITTLPETETRRKVGSEHILTLSSRQYRELIIAHLRAMAEEK
jgi:hypothetical protein